MRIYELKSRKKIITAAVGLLMGAGALVLFLVRIRGHWGELWARAGEVRHGMLSLVFLFIALMYVFRVLRWKLLLSAFPDATLRRITSAFFIGLSANNVLPARAGELIRPYVLQRGGGMGFSQALASVVLDRIFDLFGLLLLALFTGMLFFILPGAAPVSLGLMEQLKVGTALIAGISAISAAVFVFVFFYPNLCRRIAGRCAGFLPALVRAPFSRFIESVLESILALQNRRAVFSLLLFSAFAWFSQAVSTFFLAASLGVDIGPGGAFLATLAVCVAVALPQAPGFIGTYHLAALLAAGSFAVPTAHAAVFAIFMWAVNILPVTFLGVILFVREGARDG